MRSNAPNEQENMFKKFFSRDDTSRFDIERARERERLQSEWKLTHLIKMTFINIKRSKGYSTISFLIALDDLKFHS